MLHYFIEAVCRTPDRISANSVRPPGSNRNFHSRNTLRVLRHRSLSRIYRCFASRRKSIPMPHRPSDEEPKRFSPDGCLCILPCSSYRRHPKRDIAHPGASEYPQAHAFFSHVRGTNRCSSCRDGFRRSAPALFHQTRVNPPGSLH